MTDAQARRRPLAAALVESGVIRSDAWRHAVDVQRGQRILDVGTGSGYLAALACERAGSDGVTSIDLGSWPEWLEMVYSDRLLVLRLDGDEPCSSSSMPAVMATMLETLAVRDDDSALEIGTGSGYNAALLCERLGSNRITTIDCDIELVEAARRRLSEQGYKPTVAAGDGFFGYPPNARYDRVIATCRVRQVSRAWITQTRAGGLILAMLPYAMAQLTVGQDGSAEGRFHPFPFGFMPMHGHWPQPPSRSELIALVDQGGETRPYGHPALVREEKGREAYPFLTRLVIFGHRADVQVDASRYLVVDLWDSSWSLYNYEEETVTEGGPRRLWDIEVALYDAWCSWGRPPRERFGLTVPADGGPQEVWLDDPLSEHRWTLAGWEPEP